MKRVTPVLVSALVAGLVAGCAAPQFKVEPADQDVFRVWTEGTSPFTSLRTLKDQALKEADHYCYSQHKGMEVVEYQQAAAPAAPAGKPLVEVHFRCTRASTPD